MSSQAAGLAATWTRAKIPARAQGATVLNKQVGDLTVTVEAQPRGGASCRLCLTISAGERDLIVVDRKVALHDSDCAAMERTALEVATALAESLRDGRIDPAIAAD